MAEKHAEHRQYEADYYGEASKRNQHNTGNLSPEDKKDVQDGAQARTQQDASQYSVTQGEQLLQGQTTRGDAPAPDQFYQSLSHEDMYKMVHDDLETEGINNRGRVANDMGNWLADISNQFNAAANAADTEWQGNAAGQANGFFQATAGHAEQTSQAVQLSSNHYSQQAAAAHYAKTNMPEPTGFDQQAEVTKAGQQLQSGDVTGWATTMNGVAAKQQQADAAHAQAVQVMQGLDGTYHGTASTQPTYVPPPMPGQGDSTSVSGFHGTGGGTFSGVPEVGTGGNTGSSTGGFSPGTQPPGTTPQPPGGGYVPPGATTGSGTGNLGGTGGFRAPGAPTGGFPGVRPDGLALAGPQGTTPGGGGGDITRGKPGTAGRGFAGSRVSGGGYTPKGAEVEGKGAGSGAAKGGAERLERGATAAANAKTGKPGAPGAAGTGAGKKKDEDKEHKNKLPVTDDEIFEVRPERGPDGEKITPPVIGS